MLRFQPDLVLGLSAKTVAWNTATQAKQSAWQIRSWNGSIESLKIALNEKLASSKLHLMLGPSLARHWLQTPVTGIATLSELHAVATARALQLFGSAHGTSTEPVSWHVCGDWRMNQNFICTAWPSYLSDIEQPLSSALILALDHYRSALPRNGWLAVIIAGELSLLQIKSGKPMSFRSTRLSPHNSSNELQDQILAEWQREKLRAVEPNALEQRIHWLNLMPNFHQPLHSASIIPIKPNALTPFQATPSDHTIDQDVLEAQMSAWIGHHLAGVKS